MPSPCWSERQCSNGWRLLRLQPGCYVGTPWLHIFGTISLEDSSLFGQAICDVEAVRRVTEVTNFAIKRFPSWHNHELGTVLQEYCLGEPALQFKLPSRQLFNALRHATEKALREGESAADAMAEVSSPSTRNIRQQ